MLKIIFKTLPVAGLLLCSSCASHWQMTGVERTRILVDKRYDAQPDAQAAAFLKPFADEVNKEMSPVVGRTARYMASHRPESELSNLLSDILIWGGARFGEKPDFGVYNIGGIRAALPQGEVTVGDVLDVAPFDNKIYFLTLTGDKVLELFAQIAHRGGEGVSHSVCLHISRDGKLLSATVGGQPVDKNRSYRIATLDYVSQGNDEMVAFKAKTGGCPGTYAVHHHHGRNGERQPVLQQRPGEADDPASENEVWLGVPVPRRKHRRSGNGTALWDRSRPSRQLQL